MSGRPYQVRGLTAIRSRVVAGRMIYTTRQGVASRGSLSTTGTWHRCGEERSFRHPHVPSHQRQCRCLVQLNAVLPVLDLYIRPLRSHIGVYPLFW